MMDDLPKDAPRKICLCMSVTDEEIAACYHAGHRELGEIREITRACTRCFGCEADLTSFYTNVLAAGKYKAPSRSLRTRLMRRMRRQSLYRLAQAAYPAQQVSLLVSDVPDTTLDALASGPTMPDSTSIADCYAILEKHRLLEQFREMQKMMKKAAAAQGGGGKFRPNMFGMR